MSPSCPDGHESATTDYCDQCGARIAGAPPVSPPAPDSQPTTVLEAVATPEPCPECGAERAGGERFCECCGYDLSAGVARAGPDPAAPAPHTGWEAVLTADRDYFGRLPAGTVEFPEAFTPRIVALEGDEIRIGRRSATRGIAPEIDLADPPQDPAVSHSHAVLVRQEDGSYAVIDVGSTNGTIVGDGTDPIAAHTPVTLADGDRVRLGAWTAITVRRAGGRV